MIESQSRARLLAEKKSRRWLANSPALASSRPAVQTKKAIAAMTNHFVQTKRIACTRFPSQALGSMSGILMKSACDTIRAHTISNCWDPVFRAFSTNRLALKFNRPPAPN